MLADRTDKGGTAFADKSGLTPAALQRHFIGKSEGDILGLYSTARAVDGRCLSRWGVIDADCHDDEGDPEANLRAMLAWRDAVGDLFGASPILEDSNGRGGFHLWLVFREPVATELVFGLLKRLTEDWRAHGLAEPPETFPKQAKLKPREYGNWLRLFGRHHTHAHWSKFYRDGEWLEGLDAIRSIIGADLLDPGLIPAEAASPPTLPSKAPAAPKAIAVQLDDAKLAAEALGYLTGAVDDYAKWIRYGMCLRGLGNIGLGLWDDWSRNGRKYREGACESKWKGFDADTGVTLGTLFAEATAAGWPGQNPASKTKPKPLASAAPAQSPSGTQTTPLGIYPPAEGPAAKEVGRNDGGGTREDKRPEILITTQEHEVIDAAVEALEDDPTIFRRGPLLVTIIRETGRRRRAKSPDPIERPKGTPKIIELPSPRLRERMTKFGRWIRSGKTREGDAKPLPAHPPDWAVAGVAARGEWPGLRPLTGIVETPALRPDGSVLEVPGWDDETGLLYEPSIKFPPVPPAPTKLDAWRAAAEILDVVRDFPFAPIATEAGDDEGAANRAAWLAAYLTTLARSAIDGPVPLFLFDANTPGTGKSKLCDLVSILVTGREMARVGYAEREEEMQKIMMSIAMAALPTTLFDNLATGTAIGGKSIDMALTSMVMQGRILGRTEMSSEMPWRTVLFATGNNLGVKGDAMRRLLVCQLATTMEHPEERRDFSIKGDILAHTKSERGRLVVAGLTILKAYFEAGRPEQGLVPMDFPAWSGVIRNAIAWSIGVDPAAARSVLRKSDPESAERRAMVEGWAELDLAERGVTAAEALEQIRKFPERLDTLRSVLMGWTRNDELPSAGTVGKRLGQIKGRVIGGRSIQQAAGSNKNLTAWRCVAVGPEGDAGDAGDAKPASRENGAYSCNTVKGETRVGDLPHLPHLLREGPMEVVEL